LTSIYQDKIAVAGMVKYLEATLLSKEYYIAKSTTIILNKVNNLYKLEYLLGLLNSKLYSYIYREINKHNAMAGGYMNVSKKQLDDFLFLEIDKNNIVNLNRYNQVVTHVEQLLKLNKELNNSVLESKKDQVKQKIEYNEDKINELVYQLYDLTKEEIELVESN
jgi:hypothetical protein